MLRNLNSPDNVESIPLFTARAHEKNTVISLFQKLECSIFFKKVNNSGFGAIL